MKKRLTVFKWIQKQLTSLKKKIMEALSPEDYKVLNRIFQGEKIEIYYKNNFRKVLRIEFSGKNSYLIIDDGDNTQVFFSEIKQFQLVK